MKALAIVYGYAQKRQRDALPHYGLCDTVEYIDKRMRKVIVKDLAEWNRRRLTIENDVRRKFHLFMLLSGARPEALNRAPDASSVNCRFHRPS